jgi:hypothetical protein
VDAVGDQAGELSRFPARQRMIAAISLPMTPTTAARNSAPRCRGLGVEEAGDHPEQGEQGAGQDDDDDEVARPELAPSASEEEGDAEWDRGQ